MIDMIQNDALGRKVLVGIEESTELETRVTWFIHAFA